MKFNEDFSKFMTESTFIDNIAYFYEKGIFDGGLVCESGKAVGIYKN